MVKEWKLPGVPQKGWTLQKIEDTGSVHETCMMCGQEELRFVHVMSHPDMKRHFRVGERCAGRMIEEYLVPESRRKWRWRISAHGNHYLRLQGNYLLIYHDIRRNHFKVKLEDSFDRKTFSDLLSAKARMIETVNHLKKIDVWDNPEIMAENERDHYRNSLNRCVSQFFSI